MEGRHLRYSMMCWPNLMRSREWIPAKRLQLLPELPMKGGNNQVAAISVSRAAAAAVQVAPNLQKGNGGNGDNGNGGNGESDVVAESVVSHTTTATAMKELERCIAGDKWGSPEYRAWEEYITDLLRKNRNH